MLLECILTLRVSREKHKQALYQRLPFHRETITEWFSSQSSSHAPKRRLSSVCAYPCLYNHAIRKLCFGGGIAISSSSWLQPPFPFAWLLLHQRDIFGYFKTPLSWGFSKGFLNNSTFVCCWTNWGNTEIDDDNEAKRSDTRKLTKVRHLAQCGLAATKSGQDGHLR